MVGIRQVAVVVALAFVGGAAYWLLADTDRAARGPVVVAPPAVGQEVATFGTGCFWCTEAVFQQLNGVQSVTSGYTGGTVPNPTYRQICTGDTGHAEVVRVVYDPAVISFAELLAAFWFAHDPTQLNRQGNDFGTQYRSAVFYHGDAQRDLAEQYKAKLDASGAYRAPAVTEIVPAGEFYPAESYHQNYYADNGGQPYCRAHVRPKVEAFRQAFKDKLKSGG